MQAMPKTTPNWIEGTVVLLNWKLVKIIYEYFVTFQFQPLSNKTGRDRNLARLIEHDRVERANDKNARHAWA